MLTAPRLLVRAIVASSLVLSVAVATFAVRAAAAQPITPDKKNQARRYVDSGLAAHDAGDYDTAILFFEKAYELKPHPLLWFNMAQSHRLAGRLARALELYQKYLSAEPKGPQSASARAFIWALKEMMAEEARRAEVVRAAEEARKAEESRKAEAARKAEDVRLAEERRKARAKGRGLRLAGLAAGGVGLASFGVAFVFDREARSLADELSRPNAAYDPRKVDEGRAFERRSNVALVAGGVLVVGGAVLYVVGHRKSGRVEHVALTPQPLPGGIGLAVSGGLP